MRGYRVDLEEEGKIMYSNVINQLSFCTVRIATVVGRSK